MPIGDSQKSGEGLESASRRGAAVVGAIAPRRVVITRVEPEIDGGRHPIKRVAGEWVEVHARAITEGHDLLRGVLLHRREEEEAWTEEPLERLPNDAWSGRFRVGGPGQERYALEVWVDPFETWQAGFRKKVDAGVDVIVDIQEAAAMVWDAAIRAEGDEAEWLQHAAEDLARARGPEERIVELARSDRLGAAMARHGDRSQATRYDPGLVVQVERPRARIGAWYEFFPRSCASEPGRHGHFRDCEARLEHAARMGFDVVYLPPIHPIGRSGRKGPNNTPHAGLSDPGSPWAIGAEEGGHRSVHPELGTLEDFDHFVERARELGLEVALDIAFQCSPDHPWVREHPDWFRQRPDGSIHYAENPPKRYEDIYPFEFDCKDWQGLWNALRDVILFWIDHDVTIFRVDNPHTKPFAFWEWLIAEVRRDHPETIWLSEAFTRPTVLQHLAKIGFSQSYTYFTWRNRRDDLTQYVRELWSPPISEYLRPNFFANTPDILHEYLQVGGRAAFMARLVLAATLADSYGIYGPPFELCIGDAVPGTEEYLDSEKYQVRWWDMDHPGQITSIVARINRIRREQPALRDGGAPLFCEVDNEELIAFARRAREGDSSILVVVNLDPHHAQSGWLRVPTLELGLGERDSFQVDDLLGGGRYLWSGGHNYVALDPAITPAHVFLIRHRVHSENDFEYFL
ncbi:MAG: alpha-1,4-glucan--maltose-1-phosphate maltosyltransferase [bacterium]